jgi:DNA repair protein RecO
MIYRGIFLRSFPIRESSFIVKVLTDQEGSVPVFLRGKKKNIFRKLVFPGTLMDVELIKTKSEIAILNEYNVIRSPEIKSFNQSILLLSYLDIIDKIARGVFESVERVAKNIISNGETQFKDQAWLVRCLNEEFYCAGFLDAISCNENIHDYKTIKSRIIEILGYLPKSIKLVDKEVYGKNLDF